MANITLLGASYTDVPAVTLPQTGGGTVTFYENGGSGGVITETVMDATITATDQDTSGYVAWVKTQWYDYMSETLVDDTNYIVTIDGTPYLCHANAVYGGSDIYCGDTEIVWGTPANSIYPFAIGSYASGNVQWMIGDNQPHSVKVEKVISMSDSTTLTTKSITANGTYSASDDDADGYSEVTVNVPSSGGSDFPKFTVVYDPSTSVRVSGVCDKTFAQCLDYIDAGKAYGELTEVWDASYSAYGTVIWFDRGDDYVIYTAMNGTSPMYDIRYNSDGTIVFTEPSANNVVLNITQNGTTYPTGVVTEVNVNVPLNVNVQTVQSTTRRNNTALGSITSLTCSTAGTYDVYWSCSRSNTSQTWSSQLYINGTAYGGENATWSNNVQNNHLTGVVLSANDTVAVYGRSRSGYYIYVPQLTIVQTA